VGDLINKEVTKKTNLAIEIEQSRETYSYVKDEIVIQLVDQQIKQLEGEQKSWIIEGFPRTEM
jgi:adenylate kinase family enzyme